ncbi:hypothetical protein C2G38_2190757 [Gigaspora rosea]|uniref:Uncharacterized protein n=1 Tax=Gigaspora rosea TaxID=44941 RepID=A0A397VA58_9GLOM|nr:hypothetical protein C2G38_2190757 [Gigaspora rosea]
MALFLLQYFQEVFHNREKSIPNPTKKLQCRENKCTKKMSKKNSTNKTSTKKTHAKALPKKLHQRKKKTLEIYPERRRENKLIKEDLDDDENDVKEGMDKVSEEIEEALDTSSRLAAEIYKIENW